METQELIKIVDVDDIDVDNIIGNLSGMNLPCNHGTIGLYALTGEMHVQLDLLDEFTTHAN